MTDQTQKQVTRSRPRLLQRFRPVIMILALIVLLLPIDAIPDITPIVGWLDDLIALSYLFLELIARLKHRRPDSQ